MQPNKTCPKCSKQHNKDGVFCSRSCANSRARSQDTKDKISNKLRTTFNKCIVCGNITPKRKKTCSSECLTVYKKTKTPPTGRGGIRTGSGRGKHGWYNDCYFDSTYELAYYIFCIDHGHTIIRNKTGYTYSKPDGSLHKYYPDFRVDGKLVEIKGYWRNDLDFKISAVPEHISVLFAEDLQPVFAYVENKTGLTIKQLHA